MIEVRDIMAFIKNGLENGTISLGMSVANLEREIGGPSDAFGDSVAGYIHYKYFRFGFFNGHVDEIAILFEGESGAKFDISDVEGTIECVSQNTKLHQFIQVLNNSGIKWSCEYKKNEFDYCSITTSAGSVILFELETGSLIRISLSSKLDPPAGGK